MAKNDPQTRGVFRSGFMGHPLSLMLITGTLIGMKFPLGKVAANVGISPMMWALTVSAGAAVFLLPMLLRRQRLGLPKGRLWRYIFISGLVSFVIPNLLLYSVIPHLGAGYSGLMFALSPLFTFTLAAIFRLEKPGRLKLVGVLFGLVGAAMVSLTRGEGGETLAWTWVLVALIIPLALASGNIYRTIDWPEGTPPEVLAFWSHVFAVGIYLCLFLIRGGGFDPGQLLLAPLTALVQIVIAGITFPIFFLLQKRGGPVLLSHIGYVAAAIGLLAGTLLLGERYGGITWIGAGVIVMGMAFTFIAELRKTPKSHRISVLDWLEKRGFPLAGKG